MGATLIAIAVDLFAAKTLTGKTSTASVSVAGHLMDLKLFFLRRGRPIIKNLDVWRVSLIFSRSKQP